MFNWPELLGEEGAGPVSRLPYTGGPFPIRNLHPLFLPFYQPVPDQSRAAPPSAISLFTALHYASVQRIDQKLGPGGEDLAIFDGEVLRWSIFLRAGLLDRLEATVEIPFHSMGAGFLDPTIEGVHDITGFIRDNRQSFNFDETLRIDGRTSIDEPSTGLALADIPVSVKYQLLDRAADPVGLALRAGIELPSGNESRWIGNGGVDGSVGFLVDRSFWDWTIYLGFDYRFFTTPPRFRENDLTLRPVPSGFAALEWQAFVPVSFIVQVAATQNPFVDSDLETLRNAQVEIAAGIRFRIGDRIGGIFGFTEDLVYVTSPDVSFFLGLGVDLDP